MKRETKRGPAQYRVTTHHPSVRFDQGGPFYYQTFDGALDRACRCRDLRVPGTDITPASIVVWERTANARGLSAKGYLVDGTWAAAQQGVPVEGGWRTLVDKAITSVTPVHANELPPTWGELVPGLSEACQRLKQGKATCGVQFRSNPDLPQAISCCRGRERAWLCDACKGEYTHNFNHVCDRCQKDLDPVDCAACRGRVEWVNEDGTRVTCGVCDAGRAKVPGLALQDRRAARLAEALAEVGALRTRLEGEQVARQLEVSRYREARAEIDTLRANRQIQVEHLRAEAILVRDDLCRVATALQVIVLGDESRQWLVDNDPQALKQAVTALGEHRANTAARPTIWQDHGPDWTPSMTPPAPRCTCDPQVHVASCEVWRQGGRDAALERE